MALFSSSSWFRVSDSFSLLLRPACFASFDFKTDRRVAIVEVSYAGQWRGLDFWEAHVLVGDGFVFWSRIPFKYRRDTFVSPIKLNGWLDILFGRWACFMMVVKFT